MHPDKEDKRIWIHDGSKEYSSAAAYALMQSDARLIYDTTCRRLWNKLLPLKASIFGWRLLLHRLPTKVELFNRGSIDLSQLPCLLCGLETESTDDLFAACTKSNIIWQKLFNWWNIPTALPNTIHDIRDRKSVV